MVHGSDTSMQAGYVMAHGSPNTIHFNRRVTIRNLSINTRLCQERYKGGVGGGGGGGGQSIYFHRGCLRTLEALSTIVHLPLILLGMDPADSDSTCEEHARMPSIYSCGTLN